MAPRPRVSKWGTYYPAKYTNWMKSMELVLPDRDFTEPAHIAVVLEFVVTRAKTSKLTRPVGDIDNYVKAILDALTKKRFWKDDVEIVDLAACKRFAEPDEVAHTNITIHRSRP